MTRQQELREYQAAREGLRRRLIDDRRMSDHAADVWLAAWIAEADGQGIEPTADYWKRGSRWILEQVADGKKPPAL